MKHTLVLAVLGLAGAGAAAQEVGLVVASTPVIQQVAVPRQVCTQQQVVVQQQPSGAGALLGTIAGIAVGSQIGGGGGRGAAMAIGGIGGAVLGNQIEGGGQHVQNVPHCTTETSYENRTVAWNLTYEYAGRQYQVQLPYDPGPTLRLQITPVGSAAEVPAQAATPASPVVVAPPVAVAPQVVAPQVTPMVIAAPVVIPPAPPVLVPGYGYPAYPAYAPMYRPYPPVSISLGFGYVHHRHHRHRRWR